MNDIFVGAENLDYAISAGNSDGQFFDFSLNRFSDSPTIKHKLINNFSNISNVFIFDSSSIVNTYPDNIFIFVHESGSSLSNPVAVFEYFEVGIGLNNITDFINRTNVANNPSPQSNRRAQYLFGERIISV